MRWGNSCYHHPLTSISATVAVAATLTNTSPLVSTNTVRLLEVDDDSLGGFGVGATGAASVLIPAVPSDDCKDIYNAIVKNNANKHCDPMGGVASIVGNFYSFL